ncbi:hypothetical protein [Streptomyces sp. NBC_00842]|uniref:hypothetical protein n=1 Tax=Streptomyces sp. NBC_00842 TaxID=2975848 RepID=UPI0038647FF4|nr:hypothetical protein OH821_10640 [Streptomyces sp. NBC_00842]
MHTRLRSPPQIRPRENIADLRLSSRNTVGPGSTSTDWGFTRAELMDRAESSEQAAPPEQP